MRRQLVHLSVAVVFLITASCGVGRSEESGRGPAGATLTVLAAASLTEVFQEMGRRFEVAHPGARLSFNFGASSTLVHQVRAGAPADVLATADERTMQDAEQVGAVGPPQSFATNSLAIVVARGNPERILSLADLSRPGLSLVLCAPEVPCGSLAAGVLRRAGVRVEPRSLEANVKAVVSKVALGEADAGLAYLTDVAGWAGRVEAVTIPPEHNLMTRYLVAVARGTGNRSLAEAFLSFVLSDEGRRIVVDAGFQP